MPDISPDTQINQHHTVESFEELVEGTDFVPYDPSKDHFLCDFCSKGVNYSAEPRIGMYWTDDILNQDDAIREQFNSHGPETLTPLASYCQEHAHQLLYLPCEGFAELRVMMTVGEEQVMRDVEVTDVSPADDGIPWNPRTLTERITEEPFGTNAVMAALALGGEQLWGPENIVTSFLSSVEGVDLRDVVQWDGSLDPKALGRARKEYHAFMKKMQANGYDRQKFTKEVRGE